MPRRQILAYSGTSSASGVVGDDDLVDHAISLAGRDRPRVCYLPTALGDPSVKVEAVEAAFAERRPDVRLSTLRLFPQPSIADPPAHLLEQDVVLVEGGSVVNLMAVWRAHGLDRVMRACWEAGVVLAGVSAGSLCWHVGGPTDSFRDDLDPFTDGIGLLPFSNGVHDDDADQPRRATYRQMVADRTLPAGYATEDGVGLHFVGTELAEAVTVRQGAQAWWVAPEGDGQHVERAVETRPLDT
jgi:peptidase E